MLNNGGTEVTCLPLRNNRGTYTIRIDQIEREKARTRWGAGPCFLFLRIGTGHRVLGGPSVCSTVSTMPAHYINRSRSCLAVHCLVYTSSINSFSCTLSPLASANCGRYVRSKNQLEERVPNACVMCTVYFDEEVSLTALTCWDVYVLRKTVKFLYN